MRNWTALIAIVMFALMLLVCFGVRGLCEAAYSCRETRAAEQRARELEQRNSENYARAVEYLQNGNFSEARRLLDYLWDYRDGEALRSYALARIAFAKEDYTAYFAYDLLEEIPAEYDGDLFEEIAAFREEAEPYRAEKKAAYDAERQRQEERYRELMEKVRELEEKTREKMAQCKEPYVGMSSRYISDTRRGRYDSYEYKDGVRFYYWTKNGSFFYASVKDGTVIHTGGTSGRSGSGSTGRSGDPYDASDYAHVDDFYYDHRDDFFNYQDAEDYYDAHH